MKTFINSFGLIFDIVGVLLIWKYGIPEPISKDGTVSIAFEGIDESEKMKAKRYDRVSHVGIFLLVLGFALQLLSNFF